MTLKKYLCISLLLMLLTALLCISASAVEGVTMTTLDPDTGEVMPEGEEDIQITNSDVVILSAATSFERSTGEFLIDSGGVSTAPIRSNVPNGILTRDPVKITVPTGTTPVLYRDGVDVTAEGLEEIKTPGSYVLDLSGSLSRSVQPFKFTIIDEVINAPDIYRVPDGFSVDYVLLGEESLYTSSIMAEFSEDGEYNIKYSCPQADKSFQLRFRKDTVPPEAVLDGVVDEIARGPVTVYLSDGENEDDVTAYLTLDGTPVEFNNPIKERGKYSLTLVDRAGNSNVYNFRIRFYLNLNSIFFILLFGGSAAVLITYLIVSRKKLRVR